MIWLRKHQAELLIVLYAGVPVRGVPDRAGGRAMTADEIARLREVVEHAAEQLVARPDEHSMTQYAPYVSIDEWARDVIVRDVPRLLDERDALLDYVIGAEYGKARARLRDLGLIGGES